MDNIALSKLILRKLVLSCIIIQCVGCSASKIIVSENYRNRVIRGAELAIVTEEANPIMPKMVIERRNIFDHQKKESKPAENAALNAPLITDPENPHKMIKVGDPKKMIFDFYKYQLSKSIKDTTYLKEVYNAKPVNAAEITTVPEVVVLPNGAEPEIELPVKGSEFLFKDKKPDFVVYITELIIKQKSKSGNRYLPIVMLPVTGAMSVGIGLPIPYTREQITCLSYFYIWNNKLKELVSHGFVEAASSNIKSSIDQSSWEKVTRDYATKMFINSPFMKISSQQSLRK